jgi:hypothetical protein
MAAPFCLLSFSVIHPGRIVCRAVENPQKSHNLDISMTTRLSAFCYIIFNETSDV